MYYITPLNVLAPKKISSDGVSSASYAYRSAAGSNSRATMKYGDLRRNRTVPYPGLSSDLRGLTSKSGLCTSSSQGVNCRKRVKFDPSTSNPHDCPRHFAEGEDTRSYKAKTSEYAFFKKFKEDTGPRFDMHAPPKNEMKSPKFKSRDCFREKTTATKSSSDFKSSFSIEIATPINYYSLESSVGDSTICSGIPYGYSDFFYRKRQKLRQYVTNVSFPGIDEPSLKGDDFVSLLLSRLIPVSSKHSKFEGPCSWKLNADINSNELPSQTDIHLEKLQCFPERNIIKSLCDPYFDDVSSIKWNRSRGRILSFSDNSTNSGGDIHLEGRISNFDSMSDRITPRDKNNSSFCFAVEEYKSNSDTLGHFNELDYFHDQDETLPREQHTLLLGWTNEEDEMNLNFTYPGTDLNISPKLLTWQSMANSTDAITLHSSFLSPSFITSSLPRSGLINCYDFESETMKVKEKLTPQLSDCLSGTPEYAKLTESCIDFESLPPQSSHCLMSKVFHYQHLHDLQEVFSSSRIIFDLGHEYLSESNFSSDHYKPPYPAFHILKDESMSSVLTDDKLISYLDAPDLRGIFFDDGNVIPKDLSSHYWHSCLAREKVGSLLFDNSSCAGDEEDRVFDTEAS